MVEVQQGQDEQQVGTGLAPALGAWEACVSQPPACACQQPERPSLAPHQECSKEAVVAPRHARAQHMAVMVVPLKAVAAHFAV